MSQDRKFDLVEESDRGCVLVGAAILEQRLEEIFREAFAHNGVPKTLQTSIFDSNGPLSTFSGKIKLAYALGYISKAVFEDLETIRGIRNEFAHTPEEVDFIGHKTASKIEGMHSVKGVKDQLRRFSPVERDNEGESNAASSVGAAKEIKLRTMGYIKYTKAIFSFGVRTLEIELLKSILHLCGGVAPNNSEPMRQL